MTATTFLAGLTRDLHQLLTTVRTELEPLELAQLNQHPAPGAWSALECLEHLNRYSRYYNPRFGQALAQPGPPAPAGLPVRYSWLGRRFIGLMSPNNTKKVKTFAYMNPGGSQLGRPVLTEFYAHQQHLLELLARAGRADLNRRVVPVEFLRLLKLRLGEAVELQVLHMQRHVQQAQRARATVLAGATRAEASR